MTPIQKLDTVLNFLTNDYPLYKKFVIDNSDYHSMNGIVHELVAKYPEFKQQENFNKELGSIMDKLSFDGYANKELVPDGTQGENGEQWTIEFYSLNFDGAYFSSVGNGYLGLDLAKTAQNIRLEAVEHEQKVNRNWLLWLTIILTVSGVITAVYNLVELYWKYHWFRV